MLVQAPGKKVANRREKSGYNTGESVYRSIALQDYARRRWRHQQDNETDFLTAITFLTAFKPPLLGALLMPKILA